LTNDEAKQMNNGQEVNLVWIAHLFSHNSNDGYHSIGQWKALGFFLMNRFFLMSNDAFRTCVIILVEW